MLTYARIRPSVLQIEYHPYLTQEQLVNYAKSQQIAITAYSSFGSYSYVAAGLKIYENSPNLLKEPILEQIAKNHNKSVAQVCNNNCVCVCVIVIIIGDGDNNN